MHVSISYYNHSCRDICICLNKNIILSYLTIVLLCHWVHYDFWWVYQIDTFDGKIPVNLHRYPWWNEVWNYKLTAIYTSSAYLNYEYNKINLIKINKYFLGHQEMNKIGKVVLSFLDSINVLLNKSRELLAFNHDSDIESTIQKQVQNTKYL